VPSEEGILIDCIPKIVLEQMCDCVDYGERYPDSSRYVYSTNIVSENCGIRFGNAITAVKYSIIKHFGENKRVVRITKIGKDLK